MIINSFFFRIKLLYFLFLRILFKRYILKFPWDFSEIILLEVIKSYSYPVSICIVGAYRGDEVNSILGTRNVQHIYLFEPVLNNFKILKKKFNNKNNITIINKIVSNQNKILLFKDNNIPGTGSILKLSELSKNIYNLKKKKTFLKKSIKLDSYFKNSRTPDILWIDTQGSELLVLFGATKILNKVSLIFIEVSIWKPLYINAPILKNLEFFLKKFGFSIFQLSVDKNGIGNALFSKYKKIQGVNK